MGKKAIAILCAAAVLLACAIGFWLYTDHHRRTYITINGTEYLRETTELDLSGTDAPELDKLAGLSSLRSPEQVAAIRGKSVEEIVG